MLSLTNRFMAPILVLKILCIRETASFLQEVYVCWTSATAGPTYFKEEECNCCYHRLQSISSSQHNSYLLQFSFTSHAENVTAKPGPVTRKIRFCFGTKEKEKAFRSELMYSMCICGSLILSFLLPYQICIASSSYFLI